jgi:hypothetical protein
MTRRPATSCNHAGSTWPSQQAPESARLKSPPRSAQAGWARSIAPTTRGSAVTSASRSCPRRSRAIMIGSPGSSARRGRSPRSTIRTSRRSTGSRSARSSWSPSRARRSCNGVQRLTAGPEPPHRIEQVLGRRIQIRAGGLRSGGLLPSACSARVAVCRLPLLPIDVSRSLGRLSTSVSVSEGVEDSRMQRHSPRPARRKGSPDTCAEWNLSASALMQARPRKHYVFFLRRHFFVTRDLSACVFDFYQLVLEGHSLPS